MFKTLWPCLASIALLLASPTPGATQIWVSGPLDADTTWTAASSPVHVAGDLRIAAGVTLTIEPGVVVEFGRHAGIFVDGTLVARGTAAARILFTSSGVSPQPGFWNQIAFMPGSADATFDSSGQWTGGSTLRHVVIEAAGSGKSTFAASIHLSDARPLIEFTRIEGAGIHGTLIDE